LDTISSYCWKLGGTAGARIGVNGRNECVRSYFGPCWWLCRDALALHGWTFLRGSVAQRLSLLLVWLAALVVGGFVATILGFK